MILFEAIDLVKQSYSTKKFMPELLLVNIPESKEVFLKSENTEAN